MAYILSGSEGGATAVTGDTFYTGLFGTSLGAGLVTMNAWTLAIQSESHDITPLNATNIKSLSGLRSYTASITGFCYAIPRLGNAGLVTMTNPTYYVTNARAFSVVLEPYNVHDITVYNASDPSAGPTWRGNRPDSILRWGGSYTCGTDSATKVRTGSSGTEPIQAPSITDDTATTDLSNISLTYGDSSADENFTGEVQVTGYQKSVQRGSKNEVTFGFVGSGPLTATGTNNLFTGGGISTNTVLAPVWSGNGSAPLVFRFYDKTSSTVLYYETVDMFWRRFTINSEVGQPVSYTMDFIGNGAITSN